MREAYSLPTFSVLGISDAPENVDTEKVASGWLTTFASRLQSPTSVDELAVKELFVEGSYWRDLLALTWDFRTFDGTARITQFVVDQIKLFEPTTFVIKVDQIFGYQKPLPDVAWIQSSFEFETNVGKCSGIFRIVPTAGDKWKCHSIFTNLEELKGFPERIGPLRSEAQNHGKWHAIREAEVEFKNEEPAVLIIGGGHSGLDLAARLKCLGVKSLIIERNPRIGDNWRTRYEALCLHDPVWYDHMPYLPFPSNWPVFTPAKKIANWLESYADIMELNVWTSSTVTSASQDPSTHHWKVDVQRGNGTQRTFIAHQLVFCTGFGGGKPNMPLYPGMEVFKGQVLHSMQHTKATNFINKKVLVVGSCTSAHDISSECADNGIDVTMFQRSSTYVISTKIGLRTLMKGVYDETGPPTDLADKLGASFSNLMKPPLSKLQTAALAAADKQLLDGLHAKGFKTNLGPEDTGLFNLLWERGGGYYLDVGGSQYIIDGRVKLKSGGQITTFTEDGLSFDDGTVLEADVVIFCTGVGNCNDRIREILGEEAGNKVGQIWGLDDEGEVCGAWRDLGVKNLWYMIGNFSYSRFHSKHVALQIKAIEEGKLGTRYQMK